MVSTQIQLEDELYERLRSLATERETSLSELVRQGIERLLGDLEHDHRWTRLRRAIGSCRDPQGANDVAERHDEYLRDAYRHE